MACGVDSVVKAGPELSRVPEQALQMNPQATLVCRLKAQNSLGHSDDFGTGMETDASTPPVHWLRSGGLLCVEKACM